MKELILIRHGVIDNKDKKIFGFTDIELNKAGRRQVMQLKKILKHEKVNHIYCSDLKRCVETAQLLGINCEIKYSVNLREMNFGKWEGLSFDMIKAKFPREFAIWEKKWITYRVPGGESLTVMSKRVINEIKKILKSNKGKIVIITHEGCIKAILSIYLFGDLKGYWKMQVHYAAITRLTFEKDFVYLSSLNEK